MKTTIAIDAWVVSKLKEIRAEVFLKEKKELKTYEDVIAYLIDVYENVERDRN